MSYVICLYTPVSLSVLEFEMEGIYIYATGGILSEYVRLVVVKYRVVTHMPDGVIIGDSNLCCYVPCLWSAIPLLIMLACDMKPHLIYFEMMGFLLLKVI